MKKTKVKEIIICVISLIVLAIATFNIIGTKSFASDLQNLLNSGNATNIDEDDEEEENIIDEDDEEENIIDEDDEEENTNINNNVNTNKNINTNKNVNEGIPYAGVDNSIVFVIIAFGISAIIAYKKIRDYRNI